MMIISLYYSTDNDGRKNSFFLIFYFFYFIYIYIIEKIEK